MLDLEMPMALDRTSDLPLARWAVVRPLMNLPESRACALSDIARGCTVMHPERQWTGTNQLGLRWGRLISDAASHAGAA